MNKIDRFKSVISSDTGQNNVFLFWKSRIALYIALKSIGASEGDEVIVQGYTCVVVANAILYCGARPIYVDINHGSYCTDLDLIKSKVTKKTKAIICQNTYGYSKGIHEIAQFATSKDIVSIEDCAHGYGGETEGKINGTVCDFGFFSMQWNKPFSTGLGGILLVNREKYLSAVSEVYNLCEKPSQAESIQLLLLLKIRRFVQKNSSIQNTVRAIYRYLSMCGVVIGSSSPAELNSIDMPQGYMKTYPSLLASEGIKAVAGLPSLITERKINGARYTKILASYSKNHIPVNYHADHGFLTYPLLVTSRADFIEAAKMLNISLGDWFYSPVHPVTENMDVWGINEDELPNSLYCCNCVVNLPTSMINPAMVEKLIVDQLDNIKSVDAVSCNA